MSRSSRLAKLPAPVLRSTSYVLSALFFRRTPILCTTEVERCLGLRKDKTEVSDGRRAQGEGWGGFLHHRLLSHRLLLRDWPIPARRKSKLSFSSPDELKGKTRRLSGLALLCLEHGPMVRNGGRQVAAGGIKRKAQGSSRTPQSARVLFAIV